LNTQDLALDEYFVESLYFAKELRENTELLVSDGFVDLSGVSASWSAALAVMCAMSFTAASQTFNHYYFPETEAKQEEPSVTTAKCSSNFYPRFLTFVFSCSILEPEIPCNNPLLRFLGPVALVDDHLSLRG